MKDILRSLCLRPGALAPLLALSLAGCATGGSAPHARATHCFDTGWLFSLSDTPGAEAPGFDDARWTSVDVPHDWSIAGPFERANPTGGAGGFLPAGVGWYRKRFTVAPGDAGRRVFVEFDGVMANSDVWINGAHLGRRPNGYVGFSYELTGHLVTGPLANVLAVRADTSAQPASRWYTGAGIYRHVRLVVTDPVHLERDATFVSSREVGARRAVLHLSTTVLNQSPLTARVSVGFRVEGRRGMAPDPTGTTFTSERDIPAGQSSDFDADLPVQDPALWDTVRPALYRAFVQVRSAGITLDEDTVHFGIRDAHFDAATGFWLNGRNLKIKGVCLHADGGAFGAAVPLDVWERRLTALQALGVNAVRTAHNPPDPGFLGLCDRLGLLVMDEMFDCWTVGKNPFDYHRDFTEWSGVDTRDTVRRDRNHPSIILWSAGNEIHDTPQAELSKKILSGLVRVFHENDPTRPVTQGLFRPNVSHDYDDGLADLLDVIGTNYRNSELLAAHAARPARKIIGTENGQGLDAWRYLRDNPAYSGQFLWVGMDYLGESPAWPLIGGGGDQKGLLDRTGSPRPEAFQRMSWWSAEPTVHIARRVAPDVVPASDPGYGAPPKRRPDALLSDWNPVIEKPHDETIEVYANTDHVELFLNGRSMGNLPNDPGGAPCVWRAPFEAGILKAVGTKAGREVASHELRTAGAPVRIELTADSPTLATGWDHVDFVRATVVDASGVRVPWASDEISFHALGAGDVIAVDNADNSSHEAFQGRERRAFQGRCAAILRATAPAGLIRLSATAPGLQGASITIETTAAAARGDR